MKLTNKQLDKIKDITFRHDLHYELWDWLAKHPNKYKEDYFDEFPEYYSKVNHYSKCYACDYASKIHSILDPKSIKSVCVFCPLRINGYFLCLNGLYNKYVQSYEPGGYYDKANRKESAMLIRDMELNPMYNFKDSV